MKEQSNEMGIGGGDDTNVKQGKGRKKRRRRKKGGSGNNNNNNNNNNQQVQWQAKQEDYTSIRINRQQFLNNEKERLDEIEKEVKIAFEKQERKALLIDCKQFRLHPVHPDTSKFDSLLGMVMLLIKRLQREKRQLNDSKVKGKGKVAIAIKGGKQDAASAVVVNKDENDSKDDKMKVNDRNDDTTVIVNQDKMKEKEKLKEKVEEKEKEQVEVEIETREKKKDGGGSLRSISDLVDGISGMENTGMTKEQEMEERERALKNMDKESRDISWCKECILNSNRTSKNKHLFCLSS